MARSQSLDAVLGGTVADQSGAAVVGATVTATADHVGVVRWAVTDAEGRYTLFSLPAHTYTLKAELDGFAPSIRQAQTLHVGTTVTIDFVLNLAAVSEQVTVRGALAALETTKNTLTRIVQKDEIDALPLVNRNFSDLATLAPGVTKSSASAGVEISGSRDFQNSYQLDGVSTERQHLGDQRMPYAQDWVQEFQVLTSQFNVEFGQAAGGVVNVISRSGGNRTTGRLYGFFRDDAWDAKPAFASRKPPLDEHRAGGTAGGPLVSDRLFYFAGLEQLSSQSRSVVNSSFPSANGTFPSTNEQTLSLLKIDAFAGRAHTARFRYNGQRQHTSGSSIGGTSTEEHGRFSDVRANTVVGAWSWIVSPVMLNEVRASWSSAVPKSGCNFAVANPESPWFERSYPGAQFGCPVNFGTIAEDELQIVDNLLWTHGSHDVKLGIQTSGVRSSGDFRNFRDGRYSFERDRPFNMDDPTSYPFSFLLIQGPTSWNVSGGSVGLFLQDNWRMTNDFALNVGVRYDVDRSLTALNPLVRIDKGLHPIDSDLDNVAPRVGVAWTPFRNGKRTLLRGGGGLYYDQNHNNVASTLLLNNILVDRIVTLNANNALLNPFWPDIARAQSFLAGALAQNTIPDLSMLGGLAGATNDVDKGLQIPATSQVSAGVAHEFSNVVSTSADVVYARGFDLYVIRNTNLDPVTFRPVNPNYTSINAFGNGGVARYRALQIQATILPTTSHFLKLAYTLATNRSNTNATLSTGSATNPFDYSEDEGPTDTDVRHSLTLNGSVALPVGVQVSGIVGYRSALPYSATTNAPRPDGKPFGFRPEPRNARRGDSARSFDVRVARVIRFATSRTATALVEVFNVTNAVNYENCVGTVTSSSFGRPTTAGPKRRIQLGLRIDF